MIPGTSFRVSESVLGLFVTALGVFVSIETYMMSSNGERMLLGPQLFPYVIGIGLTIIGLCLLREAAIGVAAEMLSLRMDWMPVVLILGGLLLQLALMERLGWIVASLPMFILATMAFRERRVLISAAIGIVLATSTFFAFNALGLDLPVGSVFEPFISQDD